MRNCGEDRPELACRTYAPVGSHRDLLAYLVRRLLENGANSSFVALAADDNVPVATLLRRPAEIIGSADQRAASEHPPAARSLRAAAAKLARHRIRRARGVGQVRFAVAADTEPVAAAPLIDGETRPARPDSSSARSTRPRSPEASSMRRRSSERECRRADGIRSLEPDASRYARKNPGESRRSAGAAARAFHRAVATRGRQDAG